MNRRPRFDSGSSGGDSFHDGEPLVIGTFLLYARKGIVSVAGIRIS